MIFVPLATARKASMSSLFNRLLSEGETGTEIIAAFEKKQESSPHGQPDSVHKGDPGRLVYLVKAGEVDLILFSHPRVSSASAQKPVHS